MDAENWTVAKRSSIFLIYNEDPHYKNGDGHGVGRQFNWVHTKEKETSFKIWILHRIHQQLVRWCWNAYEKNKTLWYVGWISALPSFLLRMFCSGTLLRLSSFFFCGFRFLRMATRNGSERTHIKQGKRRNKARCEEKTHDETVFALIKCGIPMAAGTTPINNIQKAIFLFFSLFLSRFTKAFLTCNRHPPQFSQKKNFLIINKIYCCPLLFKFLLMMTRFFSLSLSLAIGGKNPKSEFDQKHFLST